LSGRKKTAAPIFNRKHPGPRQPEWRQRTHGGWVLWTAAKTIFLPMENHFSMMIIMRKILITALAPGLFATFAQAQYSTLNAHSHNDYENEPPFWLACNNHFGSIEADIWAVNGNLYVAHDEKEILPGRSLDSLYVQPIVKMFRQNDGTAWKDEPAAFQLLIDLKTPVEPTLTMLVAKVKQFPDVFDQKVNKNAVRIVITGNRPEPAEFGNYPGFIFFDGVPDQKYSKKQLKRVALYSANFRNFSSWDGTGDIAEKEKSRLREVIDSAHSRNKKIRFWNSPDDPNAWDTFIKMGIDLINTDHVVKLAEYLNDRKKAGP
jgi:alkaline phosphatase